MNEQLLLWGIAIWIVGAVAVWGLTYTVDTMAQRDHGNE